MNEVAPVTASRLRQLFDGHGVTPRKDLGQNFVVDPNTIRKIVDLAAVDPGDHVLEIGAGAGSLTAALAARAKRITAIEFDPRLVRVLRDVIGEQENVDVVQADATRVDLDSFGATRVVANLPYNIAATLVLKVLESAPRIQELLVMTQREVGERLAATPGTKIYGQTSVFVRYFAHARVAGRVSRRAFYPVPNVDSVLVKMARHGEFGDVDRDRLFELVRTAFSQRRKMMRTTVAPLARSPVSIGDALARAGIDPSARPEELDLEAFVALARVL